MKGDAMMRRMLSLLVMALLCASTHEGYALRAAVTLPSAVRVLLLSPSAKTMSLTITREADFVCASSGKEFISLRGEQGGFILKQGGYWQLGGSFAGYNEARKEGESKIGNALPWLPAYDGSWRIWAGHPDGPDLSEAEIKAACPNLSFSRIVLSGSVMWYDGQETSWLYGAVAPLTLRCEDDTGLQIKEKGHSYPGSIEIKIVANVLQMVSEVKLELCVAGSVAKEMSPAWSLEALKAQAVATRTFLVSRLAQVEPGGDYDLTDADFSYIGSDARVLGQVWQAVQSTAGQLALYQGQPIQATYHADAGGFTQNSEDVWASALPYLRGVEELFPSQGPDASWSPNPSFSGAELQQLMKAAGHGDVGPVRQITLETTAASGNAASLRFTGSEGEVTLKASQVRTALQLKSNNFRVRPPQQVLVRSRLSMIIMPVQSYHIKGSEGVTATDDLGSFAVRSAEGVERAPLMGGGERFVFSGSGWGHGVGLSQWGAKSMADQGYDYKAILMHYYTGITIGSGSEHSSAS